jgi:uncharacterized protein YecE (DUF72 family)
MTETYHIGCSGYYYPSWKGKFYPAGLQPRDWLKHYSTIFNTVELNGTFYRTPKLSDLQKQQAMTPDDFRFSAKMGKFITHNNRLKGMQQDIVAFQDLLREGLGGKLTHFLFQMPPSFHFSEENLESILSNVPHLPENVVELRHASWWNETVRAAFLKAGMTFCNVDFPGMESYFMTTSPHFYFRLHGNPELFKSSYSQEELKQFVSKLPKGVADYSIYFNNTYFEAGYTNAQQLLSIIH